MTPRPRSIGVWRSDAHDGALVMAPVPARGCRLPRKPREVTFATRVERPTYRHLRFIPGRGRRGERGALIAAGFTPTKKR